MKSQILISLKGALTYLKALILFNMNQTDNLDTAIATLDEALALDTNFNLAKISKDALIAKKEEKK